MLERSNDAEIEELISSMDEGSVRLALTLLVQEVRQQAQINQRQELALNQRIANSEWFEIPVLGAIAFFILLVIGLVSVNVSPDGVTFDALSTMKTILEAPAIAALVTAAAAAIAKKWVNDHKEA